MNWHDWRLYDVVTVGGDTTLIVGSHGIIYRSNDGETWDLVHIGKDESWELRGITGAAVEGDETTKHRAIAVGIGGSILLSHDTAQWKKIKLDGKHFASLYSVAWSGKSAVAVGAGGHIYTSQNGEDWVKRHSGIKRTLRHVRWNAGKNQFEAFANGELAVISDNEGLTWSKPASFLAPLAVYSTDTSFVPQVDTGGGDQPY